MATRVKGSHGLTGESVSSTVGVADAAVSFARAQLGKPYKFGATGPDAFDCSGLVYSAYRSAGLAIPRTTYTMLASKQGRHFTRRSGIQLGVGDLVFPEPGHVGLYVGNGQVVEAPHTGTVVQLVPLWSNWFMAIRYVEPGSGTGATTGTGPNAGVVDAISNNTAELQKVLKGLDINNPNPSDHASFWFRVLLFLLGAGMILEAVLRVVR